MLREGKTEGREVRRRAPSSRGSGLVSVRGLRSPGRSTLSRPHTLPPYTTTNSPCLVTAMTNVQGRDLETTRQLRAVFDLVRGYKDVMSEADVRHALRLLGLSTVDDTALAPATDWTAFLQIAREQMLVTPDSDADDDDDIDVDEEGLGAESGAALTAACARAWEAMAASVPLLPPSVEGGKPRAGPEHVKSFLAALGDGLTDTQASLVAERLDTSLLEGTFTQKDLFLYLSDAHRKSRKRFFNAAP